MEINNDKNDDIGQKIVFDVSLIKADTPHLFGKNPRRYDPNSTKTTPEEHKLLEDVLGDVRQTDGRLYKFMAESSVPRIPGQVPGQVRPQQQNVRYVTDHATRRMIEQHQQRRRARREADRAAR